MDISKLEERDQQEVVGYFEVLDLIDEHFEDIPIAESSLSNSTVKRMLDRLITAQLIQRYGVGPGLYYTLL